MRSSWPPACNARSPPGSPTAARAGSGPPGSRPASRWRSSTSTTPAASNATPSPTWAPWTSSPPRRTWSSSAHPAPARPTWPPAWRSGPAKPGTGSCSPPPAEWVDRLADAHHAGRLQDELRPPGPLPAAGRRRGRLHPLRTRSREPVLPARLLPLRTGQPDRHLQQDLRPLGRSLRRRRRRRRHDRPARPPRRSHRPQRRLLPTQEPTSAASPRPPTKRTNHPGGQFSIAARGSDFGRR